MGGQFTIAPKGCTRAGAQTCTRSAVGVERWLKLLAQAAIPALCWTLGQACSAEICDAVFPFSHSPRDQSSVHNIMEVNPLTSTGSIFHGGIRLCFDALSRKVGKIWERESEPHRTASEGASDPYQPLPLSIGRPAPGAHQHVILRPQPRPIRLWYIFFQLSLKGP